MPKSNFLETLQEVHRGELLDMIDLDFPELIKTVQERGGAGEITLKINVKSIGENRVEVSGSVGSKIPKRKMPASLFYANDANELQRNDPRQLSMGFESV